MLSSEISDLLARGFNTFARNCIDVTFSLAAEPPQRSDTRIAPDSTYYLFGQCFAKTTVFFNVNIKTCSSLCPANPEMVFLRRTNGQSVQLSCVPDPEQAGLAPSGVILSAETCQVQKDLLSTVDDSALRISSAYQSRLKVAGGMDSSQLNITISHLQHSDTGLYVCEFTYAVNKNPDHQSFSKNIFLFIEVKGMKKCIEQDIAC